MSIWGESNAEKDWVQLSRKNRNETLTNKKKGAKHIGTIEKT